VIRVAEASWWEEYNMWDCEKCQTQGISGLSNCPVCGAPRPEGAVSVLVLPAEDVSAASAVAGSSDSLAGEDEETAAAIEPKPQTPKTSKKL